MGIESRFANRRTLSVVSAAAAVLLGGVVTFGLLNGGTDQNVATKTPNTTEAATTDTAPETSVAETNPEPETGETPPPPRFSERAESTLFHYDVPVPAGYTIDYATGRGVSETLIQDGEIIGGIETANYVPTDLPDQDASQPFSEGETLTRQETIRIPLYEKSQAGLTDRGVVLDVDQFTFSGGFYENRVVRTYNFNDRTIRAQVTSSAQPASELIEILDDIRMFNAAFELRTDCSTLGAEPVEAPEAINAAQRERFDAIVSALVSCDWDLLEAQLDPTGFTASFGGGEAIEIWKSSEQFDLPILTTLLEVLSTTPGFFEGDAAWPAAQTVGWDELTEDMVADLETLGYDFSKPSIEDEVGFYYGWRTGITASGKWQYFVAGD